MKKTKEQIIKDLKLIDIIIEIVDARAPKSTQNPDVQEYSKNKPKIVVLNKSDLADENITSAWIKYYSTQSIPCIKVEATTGKGLSEVINQIKILYKEISSKYIEKGRTGRTAKVMVLGIPNVGKSTFINSLAKRNIAKVGNMPGVTKGKQWIKIDDNIELMDTPGMLWPKLGNTVVANNLAYLNSIGQNAVDNEEIAYELLKLLVKNYKEHVEKRYNIDISSIEKNVEINNKENDYNEYDVILEIRDEIARKKGAILSGGRINEQKVSDMILSDFRAGKFGRISIERPY